VDVNRVLKEGSRGSTTRSSVRAVLVIAEVAFSIVLLVCAALLLQTLARLRAVEPGFEPENLLTIRVVKYQPGSRQESAIVFSAAHARVLEAMRAIPGVLSASVTNGLPFTGTQTERGRMDLSIRGRSREDTKTLSPLAGADVGPDYFTTMRIPLVKGRFFNESDTPTSAKVVIINERAARLYWGDRNPIGDEVLWGSVTPSNPYCRVVGVVGNVRQQAAEPDNGVELYYPNTQWPSSNSFYVVRAAGDATALGPLLKQTIELADRTAAVAQIKSMPQRIGESLWQERLWGTMFGLFAVLSLSLAAVGLFGVMSHTVAQRTQEIGIRMALGPQPVSAGRIIVEEALFLVGAGTAFGVGGALGVGRMIRSLLHGAKPQDLSVYVLVVVVLIIVAIVAVLIPARRASRIDPIIALRSD
jgi:predicted permease